MGKKIPNFSDKGHFSRAQKELLKFNNKKTVYFLIWQKTNKLIIRQYTLMTNNHIKRYLTIIGHL